MSSLLSGIVLIIAVVLGVAVLVVIWLVLQYNGLVKLRNRFRNGFAQIDVQLKRRHELIPNLVETAKGYLSHERETLEAVIQARNKAEEIRSGVQPDDPAGMKNLMSAESGLGGALGRLFVKLWKAMIGRDLLIFLRAKSLTFGMFLRFGN